MFVMDCATPCRFLGTTENEPQQVEPEENQINRAPISEEKPEENQIKNDPASFCSSCNVEMSQVRTKFKIDGSKSEEVLPVIVYLCPKCGKIDLKADEKLRKN